MFAPYDSFVVSKPRPSNILIKGLLHGDMHSIHRDPHLLFDLPRKRKRKRREMEIVPHHVLFKHFLSRKVPLVYDKNFSTTKRCQSTKKKSYNSIMRAMLLVCMLLAAVVAFKPPAHPRVRAQIFALFGSFFLFSFCWV